MSQFIWGLTNCSTPAASLQSQLINSVNARAGKWGQTVTQDALNAINNANWANNTPVTLSSNDATAINYLQSLCQGIYNQG